MNKIAIIASLVLVIVVGFAGGYAIGYQKGGAAVVSVYAPKIAQLNTLFPTPTEVRSLSGKVTAINGMTLSFVASPVSPNPFRSAFIQERTVTITGTTSITSSHPATFAEFQAEVKTADEATGKTGTPLVPPPPFIMTSSSLSDVKVGDTVTVTAGEDIMNAPSFTATAVQIQSIQ